MQSEYGDECQLGSDQGQPGDGEHGADVGDAAALLPNHHRLRPVQEQLSGGQLPRAQLVLHLHHLDMTSHSSLSHHLHKNSLLVTELKIKFLVKNFY